MKKTMKWKDILSNKPLMFLVAILALAGIISTPQVNQYFKAGGSKAAGVWNFEKIKSDVNVSDAYGQWIVYNRGMDADAKETTVYDLINKTIKLAVVARSGDEPRISKNKVIFNPLNDGCVARDFLSGSQLWDVSQYPSPRSDIYNDTAVFTASEGFGQFAKMNLYVKNIGSIGSSAEIKTGGNIYPRIEGGYVIWTETSIYNMPTVKAFTYNLTTKVIKELPLKLVDWHPLKFNVSGDIIVVPLNGPSLGTMEYEKVLVAYQHTTGKIIPLPIHYDTTGNYADDSVTPVIWRDKIAYVLNRALDNGKYTQEIRLYNLSSKTDELVYSYLGANSMDVGSLQITGINLKPVILASVKLPGSTTYDLYQASLL